MIRFFVVEDQILCSTEGLVDERYLDDLFNQAIPRLINVIRKIMVKNLSNYQSIILKIHKIIKYSPFLRNNVKMRN